MSQVSTLVEWILSADLDRQKLSLLALCAMLVYVLGARLQCRLRQSDGAQGLALRVGRSRLGRAALQAVRLTYYVGMPVTALWRVARLRESAQLPGGLHREGLDSLASLLGAVSPGEVTGAGATLAVLGGSLCVMTAIWVWYANAVLRRHIPSAMSELLPFPWWLAVREALFMQVFWLFCRSVVRMWTGDRLWVAFASVALPLAMWLLNPLRQERLWDTSQSHVEVQHWMVTIWTGAAYLMTDLFWPLMFWHAVWLWLGGRVLSRLTGASLPAPLAGIGTSE